MPLYLLVYAFNGNAQALVKQLVKILDLESHWNKHYVITVAAYVYNNLAVQIFASHMY